MSFGRKSIDFGPIALQVGEASDFKQISEKSDQIQKESLRLKNILSCREDRPETEIMAEVASEKDLMQKADGSGEKRCSMGMTELTAELEYLWVNLGNTGSREVRLGLAPHLIPNTSVRILDHAGELHVELTVSSPAAQIWLNASLEKLTRDLGQRLHRSVHIALNAVTTGQTSSSNFRWECDPVS